MRYRMSQTTPWRIQTAPKVWLHHAILSNRGIQDDRKHAPSDSPAQRRTGAKHFLGPGIRAAHNLLQYRTFGYGHSFGTLSHYYGREAGLELREDIDTILEPNMVISMEPMIMLPEGMPGAGGYREHDILVITPEGNRNLTAFPYGPAHNIIKA